MSCPKAAVALIACGLSMLAACGGRGAITARPLLAARVPASAGPLVVDIPPETLVFATPVPSDPTKAAIMEDFRSARTLWERSLVAQGLVAPVTNYVGGTALTGNLDRAIRQERRWDLIPAGTYRLFDTRIATATTHGATVVACVDMSKSFFENAETRRVDSGVTSQSPSLEIWIMVPIGGHWKLHTFAADSLRSDVIRLCR
jgi:hypothetical protein